MKKIIIYLAITPIILGLISCEDDFLANENPNSVSDLNFGGTIEELNISLASAYGGMRRHDYASVVNGTHVSDIGVTTNTPFFFHQDFSIYNLLPSTRGVQERWAAQYQVIYRANQTLGFVERAKEEGTLDEDELRIIEAQAKFLRGATHFYLHSVFNNGEIILRDELDLTPTLLTDLNLPLSESEEVIASFRRDLEFAKTNLPLTNSANYPKGRVTAGAAATILGNSYLYQEEYDEAIEEYEDVLSGRFGYSLVTGTEEVLALFDEASEFNSESILEINYGLVGTVDENGRFDEDSFTNRLPKTIGPSSTPGADGAIGPALWLIQEYLDDPDIDGRAVSLRTSANIAVVDDIDEPYYNANNFREYRFNNFFGIKSVFKKYTHADLRTAAHDAEGPAGDSFQGTKNVILHRLPEVMINLAECYIKSSTQQNISRSSDLINELRKRWNVTPISISDPDELMKHIMFVEKPLELSIEGTFTRFIDLRRWGIGQERFDQLSTSHRGFRYDDVSFQNSEGGNTFIRAGKIQQINPLDFDDLSGEEAPEPEFERASLNYSQTNGYLPIPDIEVNFNENANP